MSVLPSCSSFFSSPGSPALPRRCISPAAILPIRSSSCRALDLSPLPLATASFAGPCFSGTGSRRRRRRCTVSSCSLMEPLIQSPIAKDSLSHARAYWVSRSIIAWNTDADDYSVYLYASEGAKLMVTETSVEGQDVKFQLELDECGLPESVAKKFPHIMNYKAFKVPHAMDVEKILKCQLAIAAFSDNGQLKNATSLQLPGVLDDMFAYSGPLGAVFNEEAIRLYLWAPTAQVHILSKFTRI